MGGVIRRSPPPAPQPAPAPTPTQAEATPSSGLTDAQMIKILWAEYEKRNGLPTAATDEDIPF